MSDSIFEYPLDGTNNDLFRQIPFNQSDGLTIKKVFSSQWNNLLIITFTDDTFSILWAEVFSDDEANIHYNMIQIVDIIDLGSDIVEAGIISEDKFIELREKLKVMRDKTAKNRERLEYERLKMKFEGE